MKPYASILIPWVDRGDPHRRAALGFVLRYWAQTIENAELVVVATDPFDWGASLNEAARAARSDLLLHSDPDSVVPYGMAYAALELARQRDGIVVAFDEYRYLARRSTEYVYENNPSISTMQGFACEGVGPNGVGNVVAYSRATWEQAGGYDERFGTWGGADAAYAYAAEAFVAPTRRIPGPMLHLWHPRLPESIPGSIGYAEQFSLLARYRDAAAEGPEAVQAIVRERDG